MNKSEELCKLFGIEAREHKRCGCGFITTLGLYYCPKCGHHEKWNRIEYHYPDLTKSENFIILLTLNPYPADVNSLACKYKYLFEYQPLNFIDAFIEELINEFKYLEPHNTMKWHKNIEQQAQQALWSY